MKTPERMEQDFHTIVRGLAYTADKLKWRIERNHLVAGLGRYTLHLWETKLDIVNIDPPLQCHRIVTSPSLFESVLELIPGTPLVDEVIDCLNGLGTPESIAVAKEDGK